MTNPTSLEPTDSTEVFVRNVREEMDKHGLSIVEMAKATDMSRTGLVRLLNLKGGNCSLATAEKIASFLKVPLWKLIKPSAKSV